MNTNDILRKTQRLLLDNSPAILTALGVTGTLVTAYLAGTASFKAAQIIGEETPHMETRDKVRRVWRLYIPAAVVGSVTVAAVIGANRIGSRRAAAVAVAYTLSEKAYAEYRDKIREKLGEKKEAAARDEITQERVNRHPLGDREVVLAKGGNVLCFDVYTGRYFRSDIETLRKAANDVNQMIINHGFVSLSDFYDMVGLAPTSVSDDIGWDTTKFLDIRYTTTLSEGNEPCLAVDINHGLIRGSSFTCP